MDCENEIVFPSTGKCAYKYWLKPEFWEINKRSDTYLAHFIQDIYLRCTDFIKIWGSSQNRTSLTYLLKENLRDP